MRRERTIIGGLLALLLVLWLGFFVHRAPRFPGSLAGGLLAVTGALLMIFPPLVYSAAKRTEFFKRVITRRVSLSALLTVHVYTGIVGSILAIWHTGHRFESNLGIALTAMMLLTVLSGFVGRYFLGYVALELREKQDLLNCLATIYNQIVGEMSRQPDSAIIVAASRGIFKHALSSFMTPADVPAQGTAALSYRAVRLAESIADLEYAIKTHELFKRRAAIWLKVHLATSLVFYLLLLLHVWSEIYFGLRWFT